MDDISSDGERDSTPYEIRGRTVSQEEDDCIHSPWGQFVDVIPHDEHGSWSTPSCYEPVSPILHSSPAYHPYSHPTKTKTSTAGLSPIPNKRNPTHKLQQRRMTEVEGAFEQLRFD